MLGLPLNQYQMYDVYCKEIRSILEFGVPVWHSSLTKKDSADIERVQRVAFMIILQEQFTTYQMACSIFSTKTLEERRGNLCLTFARKNIKSDDSFFSIVITMANTRSKKTLFMNPDAEHLVTRKAAYPIWPSYLTTTADLVMFYMHLCYLWKMGTGPGE